MAWTCRLITNEQRADPSFKPRIGDVWYADYMLHPTVFEYYKRQLSRFYLEQAHKHRAPIIILMPTRMPWCVDFKDANGNSVWFIIGEPPIISVNTTVAWEGSYSGMIINGVISDDQMGRIYDE